MASTSFPQPTSPRRRNPADLCYLGFATLRHMGVHAGAVHVDLAAAIVNDAHVRNLGNLNLNLNQNLNNK